MKKEILFTGLFVANFITGIFAQSFTTSGPRTIFDLAADKGTGKYTFFNFDSGKEVSVSDSNSTNWHIGFSGTTIILNSGTSGPGTVTGQMLSGNNFESQTSAPTSAYSSDGATAKVVPTGAGNGWYNYNYVPADGGPHTITPIANKLIAVKLADGRYVKVEILNYYQGAPLNVPLTGSPYAGTGRFYSFRYLTSAAASTDWSQLITKITNLRADYNNNQFLNLASADTVLVSDSNSSKWDLAFKGTTILVNSGLSGPGQDSAQVVSVAFDAYNTASINGWNSDNASGKAIPTGSGNGWYNYDATTHLISSNAGKTIVLKTASERFVKIFIESYYKDNNTSGATKYFTLSYYFQPDGTTRLTTGLANPGTVTSISNSSNNNSLKLFPNPASISDQNIKIGNENIWTGFTAKIYDMKGNMVFNNNISGTGELTGLHLQSGIYLVSIEGEEKRFQQKLVIE